MSSPQEPGRLKILVFSSIPLLVVLLVAELFLRHGPFRFEVAVLEVEAAGVHSVRMFKSHFTSRHFERDADTFWRPKPGRFPFNALGYRGEELAKEKSEGTFRLLAVGDSNTLGNEISWVNELGGSLRPEAVGSERIEVINAGVYGFTSFQGVRRLRPFLDYDPDVVLISFGGNESTPNTVEDRAYRPYVPHWIYRLFDHEIAILNFAEYLSVRLAAGEAPTEPPKEVFRVSVGDYRSDLLEMVEMVRSHGAVPVLMTRPMAYDYRAPDSRSPMKAYYHATLELGAEAGVGVIDVDEMSNHSWAIFNDHAHFNREGHQLVAGFVAEALESVLAGKSYDARVLQYRPDSIDARLSDLLRDTFSAWRPLQENLNGLQSRPEIAAVEPIHRAGDGAPFAGWESEVRAEKGFESRPHDRSDGALCFGGRADVIRLRNESLPFDDEHPTLFWVEGESNSDLVLRIFWRDAESAEFVEASSTSQAFYRDGAEHPIRFFHALPSSTRAVRLDAYVERWQDDICFRQIYAARLVPAAAAESP